MMTARDRRRLLEIARHAITAHICGTPAPVVGLVDAAAEHRSAFVTLHVRRALRGCIGHLGTRDPLGYVVARCAIAAATSDSRFAPLGTDELPQLSVEVSVLDEPELVTNVADIEIGRHGLIVEHGGRRGLLLPQVATKWHWDRETFLAETCRKAGLPPDGWQRGASIWLFAADVFRDEDVE